MKILRGYKFRLYPTQEQKNLLSQQSGNTRFIWNLFLNQNTEHYKQTKKFKFWRELQDQIPQLKKEHEFLNHSFSQSLQTVSRQFDRALKDFLNPKLKKHFPTLKKKKFRNDSFTIPQKYRVTKNYVFIPKVGEVKWTKHREIKGKVKFLTVSQSGEQWYCSVNVELNIKKPKPVIHKDKIVGIDVGLKTYAVLSDNTKVENPKTFYKYQKKLKRTQRWMSRKVKCSKNREKFKNKLTRIHRKIRNIRKDFQHKTTHDMITKYDGFSVEDLNISGMIKNHKRAKAVSDVAWFEFKRQLEYKAFWAGKPFVEIGRFEPSSKTCNKCGWYNKDLTLKDRTFICQECGSRIDRDWNASLNIRDLGLKILADNQEFTLLETRGFSLSSSGDLQCLSMKEEKETLGLESNLLLN